jgi:Dioxygenase
MQILLAWTIGLAALASAHPGHDHNQEAAERARYLQSNPRSLHYCAAKLKSQGHEEANLRRRQMLAETLRPKRSLEASSCLKPRDLDSVLKTSHRSNDTSFDLDTPARDLFADQSSCILQPDTTEGPYYVTGELIRRNITDGEQGVPMTLDIQIIDMSSCDPVPAIYLDMWHCNATGVYGGVVARGNGNSRDSSNLNNTAFRGLQKTDSAGVVQFDTVFPGHYTGK